MTDSTPTDYPQLPPPPPEFIGLIQMVVRAQGAARRTQFDVLPPSPGATIMLGDSITEGGLWNEWFPELAIVNRGIAGDTVPGIRARLADALGGPRLVNVLVGTNDIAPLGGTSDVDAVASDFEQLLGEIVRQAPGARIVVNSVMPRSPELAATLTELNLRYRAAAEARSVEYLDLWPALAGDDGELRREFTPDGIHLTGAGYRAWAAALRLVLVP
jgi:lysophospholipase L1-like esterase